MAVWFGTMAVLLLMDEYAREEHDETENDQAGTPYSEPQLCPMDLIKPIFHIAIKSVIKARIVISFYS